MSAGLGRRHGSDLPILGRREPRTTRSAEERLAEKSDQPTDAQTKKTVASSTNDGARQFEHAAQPYQQAGAEHAISKPLNGQIVKLDRDWKDAQAEDAEASTGEVRIKWRKQREYEVRREIACRGDEKANCER